MVREVVVRKEDLREPRLLLCKEQFGFFVSEYNLYPSYMCSDEIVDGQSGTRLRLTSESRAGIGKKLLKICKGTEGFANASNRSAFNDQVYISDVPHHTKRIQIKAYCIKDGKDGGNYLLCALLNDRGWPLSAKHGTNTISYENVFLSEVGALQCISKCDFIFYDKVKLPREEEDDVCEGEEKVAEMCDIGDDSAGQGGGEVGSGRPKRSAAVAGQKRIRDALM